MENYLKKKATERENASASPVICAQFGCGKALTHTENLYGRFCFKHSQLQQRVEIIDKLFKPKNNVKG